MYNPMTSQNLSSNRGSPECLKRAAIFRLRLHVVGPPDAVHAESGRTLPTALAHCSQTPSLAWMGRLCRPGDHLLDLVRGNRGPVVLVLFGRAGPPIPHARSDGDRWFTAAQCRRRIVRLHPVLLDRSQLLRAGVRLRLCRLSRWAVAGPTEKPLAVPFALFR